MFQARVRVIYGDTDQMGVVYYANYLRYFEFARSEFLRAHGRSYREMEAEGLSLPVVEATCRYMAPARYEDVLRVGIEVPARHPGHAHLPLRRHPRGRAGGALHREHRPRLPGEGRGDRRGSPSGSRRWSARPESSVARAGDEVHRPTPPPRVAGRARNRRLPAPAGVRSGARAGGGGRPWTATWRWKWCASPSWRRSPSARLMGRGDEEPLRPGRGGRHAPGLRHAADPRHGRHRRGRARRGAHALHRREGGPVGAGGSGDRHRARPARGHQPLRLRRGPAPSPWWPSPSDGKLLNAPDTYMEKLAVGPAARGAPSTCARAPRENLRAHRRALGRDVEDLTVVILDRPRHETLIREVRAAGARIRLIEDGDVAGGSRHLLPGDRGGRADGHRRRARGRHHRGRGPLPSAATCRAGSSRATTRRSSARGRWASPTSTASTRAEELAQGEVMFAATGVTTGDFLRGVRFFGGGAETSRW